MCVYLVDWLVCSFMLFVFCWFLVLFNIDILFAVLHESLSYYCNALRM